MLHPPLAAVFAFVYTTLLSTIAAFGLWTWLIRRHELGSAVPATEDAGVGGGPVATPVTMLAFVGSLAAGLIAMMLGQALAGLTEGRDDVARALRCRHRDAESA